MYVDLLVWLDCGGSESFRLRRQSHEKDSLDGMYSRVKDDGHSGAGASICYHCLVKCQKPDPSAVSIVFYIVQQRNNVGPLG
jgi:hypothetical protein